MIEKNFLRKTATCVLVGLMSLALTSAAIADDWPQWRGPNRDGISMEQGLLQAWPAGGPPKVWMFEDAGIGYSSFSVVDGTLYTMGARGDTEYLIALDANTGKEKWATQVGPLLTNGWGDGPRGTPTYDKGRIYTMGGRGDLLCASASDGQPVWRRSMSEFGGKKPGWGYTESVLIDGDKVVCTPGGKQGAIVALDKASGELIWQCKDFIDGAQYASIVPADHHGQRQYIQLTMDHVVGVEADSGKLLWQSDWPGRTAVIPTPIYHKGYVYVSSGYGVGCKLIKISPNNQVTQVWENKVMKNHHGGVILLAGHFYGYSDGPGWVCQDATDGDMVWNSKELGKGAIAYADNRFYCLSERDGAVVLIAASPTGWQEHGRFTLSPQTKQRNPRGKIWTHPVIANGKLYLRDQNLIYCFDIKR